MNHSDFLAARRLLGLLLAAWLMAGSAWAGDVGEQIYRNGMLPSNESLQAQRAPGMITSGATAACVNCHRRSGLGMKEGRTTVPPVAGSYLFHPRAGTIDDLDLPFVEGMRADRDPYTDTTLARAIREGVAADGKPLSYLMPHYTLSDAQMGELIAYLKTLSPGVVPGVTSSVLHFATIITPDADPVKRRGMLDVLDKFFADKNHYARAESPRIRSSRRMMFKVSRKWELHVWQLTGPADTWEAQLRKHLAQEPVFAVISGLGGTNWAPVHRFCEEQALPCLFPNLDVPVVAENDFDDLYLSKGVLLEAQLIAHDLEGLDSSSGAHKVVQVFRAGDAGEQAASELAHLLANSGVSVVAHRLAPNGGSRDLVAALRGVAEAEVPVMWLRPADIAALGPLPGKLTRAYMSGRMGGLEQAPLPAAWRQVTHMAYPFDLPERRRIQVDYPLGWFAIRKIPVVAEQVQADTYLVCGLVSDTINHMVDTFVRDYLVERIEEILEHRVITGYYPRLSLAPHQRFASKGGYLVHFAEGAGPKVVGEGDWIAP